MRPNQTRLQADHLGRDADARSYAADLVRALKEPHTVLVTGATGFIGSRLAQALAAAGHDLIVLTRNPAKAADLSPPFRLITDLDQLPPPPGSMPSSTWRASRLGTEFGPAASGGASWPRGCASPPSSCA